MCPVVFLGLTSRKNVIDYPEWFVVYGGDTLWATLVFLGICVLLPKLTTLVVIVLALAFSFAIEASQLYQAPWLNDIRSTTLGGLILGFGFKWSDCLCYAVGVTLGAGLDKLILLRGKP